MIPEGATVRIVPGAPPDVRMVDVLWGERKITVFAEDIAERGRELDVNVHRAPGH
jgi:urease beta subunit